jgi:cell surface protein SprA
VHAEKSLESQELEYGDLTCFIRVGSDFTENYYEYEVPLTFTPWGTPATDPDAIWPTSNSFEIDLEQLVDVKHRRNIAMRDGGSNVQLTFPYVEYSGDRRITVLGSPTISDVKTIMIGVRNPKKPGVVEMQPVCAEVWVNELRLTDFNKQGGWAATATFQAQLADFGQVTVAGMHSSAGFAALDSKISDVSLESLTQFDVSTDLQLGKFFPEKAGVRVPMHFDYSETHITPEYNPLDPDIELQQDLDSYVAKDQQDSVKRLVVDYTQRKNINFMNVRKDRVGAKKPRIWDIENFNVTYAYSELYNRNVDIEYDLLQQNRGGFGYNFALAPKNIRPFEKIKFISKSKALTIIKDFNFYFLPKSFSFTTEMMRSYGEMKLRDKSLGVIKIRPTFNKSFNWDRNYDLKFDLAKSLTLQFNAVANTFINEAAGSKHQNSEWYDQGSQDTVSVKNQIFSFGNMNRYTQNFAVNWTIPIDKLPFLDWTTATFSYQASYSWTASPLSIQDRMGNQIENSRTIQLNGNLAFDKLYNKSPYLKKLLNPRGRGGQRGGAPPRNRGNRDQQAQQDEAESDTTEKVKPNYFKVIGEGLLKIVLGIKKTTITYSQSTGIGMPGFIPEPDLLGTNMGQKAPGLGFTFGSQKDLRQEAGEKGWITRDSNLNQPYITKYQDAFVFRTSLEPLPDFNIEVTADRNYSENHQEYYRWSDTLQSFNAFSPTDAGSFSISYIAWGTAFEKETGDNISPTFEKMKELRPVIAEDLARQNPNWSGEYVYDSITGESYPEGYGPTSPEVLRPAFLEAYSGRNSNANRDYFPTFPLPNWRITYTGLSNIEFLARLVQKITLSHGYNSTYTISSFRTNLGYQEENGAASTSQAFSSDYISQFDFGTISIAEQFSPLFGIDMTWHNSLFTKFEYKKSRNLTMSFANNQVTEVKSNELVVGVGYRIKSLGFTIKALGGGGRKTRMESDLDIKVDFSIRSNKTVLRRIDEDINQVSAGQKIVSINTSIDYQLNQNLSIRFFFDKIINNPFVSNQYKNSTTNGGISLRFSLAQ